MAGFARFRAGSAVLDQPYHPRGEAVHTPASRRAPWRRTIALLGAATLVVAACGVSDDEEGGDSEAIGGDGTTTTAPTAEPVRGGTLTYAVEADTSSP